MGIHSTTSSTDLQAREMQADHPPLDERELDPSSDYLSSDDDEDDDDDNSSTASNSTVVFEHEPFSTFQHKISVCAHQTLWPTADPASIVVTQMKGGGFNRIVGVSRITPKGRQVGKKFIIRIPRFDDDAENITADVAALQFVRQCTSIPVPAVVGLTSGNDNAIGQPHTIQRFLKGKKALRVYGDFSHQIRCQLATELGTAFRQILSTQTQIPGVPVFPPTDLTNAPLLQTEVLVAPLPAGDPYQSLPYSTCQTGEPIPILDFISSMFSHRKATSHTDTDDPAFEFGLYDQLFSLAKQLNAKGHFDNVPYTLVHTDLQSWNVMVNENPFPGDPVLSAIIDWDGTVLAPAFMTCVPPQWLWSEEGVESEYEDESKAGDVPDDDPEQREIKRLFEDAAGPVYLRFAYDPVYRIARTILKYCFSPVCSDGDLCLIEEAVKLWEAIRE